MYIIDEVLPQEGDYYYNDTKKGVYFNDGFLHEGINKKVVAGSQPCKSRSVKLPQIDEEFIKTYCKLENKDIDVEVELNGNIMTVSLIEEKLNPISYLENNITEDIGDYVTIEVAKNAIDIATKWHKIKEVLPPIGVDVYCKVERNHYPDYMILSRVSDEYFESNDNELFELMYIEAFTYLPTYKK